MHCERYIAERGMLGVEQLAAACANQPYVGVALAKLEIKAADLANWIAEKGGAFTSGEPSDDGDSWLTLRVGSPAFYGVDQSRGRNWSKTRAGMRGKLLVFWCWRREERATWDIAASCGAEVENAYWSITRPGFWLGTAEVDFEFALRRLLDVGRPRSALQVWLLHMEEVDAKLLAEMLERMLEGQEADGPLLDSWHIGEAVERLGGVRSDRQRSAGPPRIWPRSSTRCRGRATGQVAVRGN